MKSVVFVSTHKCATSFFSGFLLRHVEGLTKCDYQEQVYHNERFEGLEIEKRDHVYGVLRVHEEDHPMTEMTNTILFDLIPSDMKTVFLVRDPRDIVVSMYYSFGFRHPISKNRDIQAFQLARRDWIQKLTLDEYALIAAEDVNKRFNVLYASIQRQEDKIVVKYEQMINKFGKFYKELNKVLPFEEGIRKKFKKKTRPREKEDITAHKRSGKVGGHLVKLKPETIDATNEILKENLNRFDYPLISEV